MAKAKVCKHCKIFVEGEACPICKDNKFSTNWQGKLVVIDAKKSKIASFVNITAKGEYAIKVK